MRSLVGTPGTDKNSGAFWVIGVSAPAVVTGIPIGRGAVRFGSHFLEFLGSAGGAGSSGARGRSGVQRGIISAGGGRHENENDPCCCGIGALHRCDSTVSGCKGSDCDSGNQRYDVRRLCSHGGLLCFAKTPSGEESPCGNNVTPRGKLLIHCGIYSWRSTTLA